MPSPSDLAAGLMAEASYLVRYQDSRPQLGSGDLPFELTGVKGDRLTFSAQISDKR